MYIRKVKNGTFAIDLEELKKRHSSPLQSIPGNVREALATGFIVVIVVIATMMAVSSLMEWCMPGTEGGGKKKERASRASLV